jgi:hypothetical protein
MRLPLLSIKMIRMASITLGRSMPFGQRETQVKQAAQVQMVWQSRTSSIPSCARRITWLGKISRLKATGQPALHLPHWLHASRFSPLISSIWPTNFPLTEARDSLVRIIFHPILARIADSGKEQTYLIITHFKRLSTCQLSCKFIDDCHRFEAFLWGLIRNASCSSSRRHYRRRREITGHYSDAAVMF